MKKPVIVLGICILVALIYFICSGPGEEKKDASLLHHSEALTEEYPGSGDGYYHEEGGYEDENSAPRDAAPAVKDTLTYRLDLESTSYVYSAIGGFNKIAASEEMTGYVANFAISRGTIDASNPSKINHVISILLPVVVTPGIFNERSNPFIVQFFGPVAGILYGLDPDMPFSLTVEEWGGPGGRARGFFAGTLKSDQTSETVVIHDGRFEASIR